MRRPWLVPLVPLYAAGAALRAGKLQVRRLAWPVISIGNLSAGGAGKTPLTIALAQLLTARGVHVDVLSRGYGRASTAAARVWPDGVAAEFGDEPLLIARDAQVPVYVAAQRYEAGMLAEAEYACEDGPAGTPWLHLLDDGFQHRQLARDVDILLLREADIKDTLLPAGNLREGLGAIQRATVIAVDAGEPSVELYLREVMQIDRNSECERWAGPVWRIQRKMKVPSIIGPVLAFCGIAQPEQFFTGLASGGMQIAACCAFRDHHQYTALDVNKLLMRARSVKASALVTTEKDAVRLGDLAKQFPADLPLHTVALTTSIDNEAAAMEWLLNRLNAAWAL